MNVCSEPVILLWELIPFLLPDVYVGAFCMVSRGQFELSYSVFNECCGAFCVFRFMLCCFSRWDRWPFILSYLSE